MKHTKLVVVQQPPVLAMPDKCTVDYFAFLRDHRRIDLAKHIVGEQGRSIEPRNEFERKLIARFGSSPNFTFIRTESMLRDALGRPNWWDGRNRLYYIDDDHLSEFGAEKIESAIRPEIRKLVITQK
jgi:hypothetical protein